MRLTNPPRSQYVGRWRRWYKKEEEKVGLDTTPQTDGLADKILGGEKIDGYFFGLYFHVAAGCSMYVRMQHGLSKFISPFSPVSAFPKTHSPN